jgi:hypothetical protein
MDYEVYLRSEAFEFLRHRHRDERNRLLRLLDERRLVAPLIVIRICAQLVPPLP